MVDFNISTGILANMKYMQYRIIACHMFKWTNLPPGLDGDVLERMLLDRGAVAFFNAEEGYYILPFTSDGQLDVYGNLMSVRAVPINGIPINQIDYIPRILYDNTMREPFNAYLRSFSERLAYIQKSIAIVERQARYPSIVKVNEANKESFARFQTKIDEGDPVIFVDDSFDENAMTVFNTGFQPVLFEALWNDYNKVEGEIYNLLGTMFNVEQNKAAGVGTAETIVNYSGTFALANARLENRQRWCEKLNAEFGIDIWCEKVNDYQDIIADMMDAKPEADITNNDDGAEGGERDER